jgi:hypothetical protein
MSAISAGSASLARPELTKAIEFIAAKAKKQFDETGNLAGFSGEYTTESGDGKITLSISSTATALYDKTAGKEDFVLQYRLQSENAQGSGNSGGSTQTISSDADIDSFARSIRPPTAIRLMAGIRRRSKRLSAASSRPANPARGQIPIRGRPTAGSRRCSGNRKRRQEW